MIAFPGMMPFSQDEMYLTYAKEAQLDFVPTFYKMAYDQFESRIRITLRPTHAAQQTSNPVKAQRRGRALSSSPKRKSTCPEGAFKWVTTLYPTDGYAQDAGMSLKDYEDFVLMPFMRMKTTHRVLEQHSGRTAEGN